MSVPTTILVTITIYITYDVSAQFMPPIPFPFQRQPSMMNQMPPMPPLPPMGQMPMSMQMPMQQQRMPMVVVPHRKPRPKKTHRRRHRHFKRDSSSSEESDSDEIDFRAKNKERSRGKRRRQVLTPVVSYVTKDGYVVYQKKIKKDKAKDWLELTRGDRGNSKTGYSLESDRD